jgi:hypothetical protein
MDRDAMLKKIRAGKAKENNGRVLRTINILRYKYNKLSAIHYALDDLSEGEFLDSVNYLASAEYIELRHVETKTPVVTELADHDYRELEAKLTAKGIQLLGLGIKDDLVEV